jgi:uncharacterized membrane protein YbhN (UPF0104 family)
LQPQPLDASSPPTRATEWRATKTTLKWLLFAILLWFVTRALWHQLAQLDWRTIHFEALPLIGAAVALAIVYAARSISFRILLHGYRVHITWPQAAVVGWIPQIGKYIPGQVASLAGAVALLRRFKVPGAVALAVVLVMDGLAVLTGLISGSPLLLWDPVRKVLPYGWLGCALLVIVGIICLHPRVYGALLNFALRKLKQSPLASLPPWHDYIGPVLLGFAQWILAGIALWLVTRSIAPELETSRLPIFIAIAGLAYTAGYLAPFAPGGLGVREAVFQATLVLIVHEHAAVAVITMRVIQTIIEILMAAAGALLMRKAGESGPRMTRMNTNKEGIDELRF